MRILYLALYVFVYFAVDISGSKILAMFAYPRKRHWDFYRPLLVGLAEKGHQVTVVGYYPLKPAMDGYSDIVLPFSEPETPTTVNIEALINYGESSHENLKWTLSYKNCKYLYGTEEIRKLTNSTDSYDVLITELFGGDCFHPFAYKFNCPLIGVTPGSVLPFSADLINLPDNPSYIPNYATSYGNNMNFLQRLLNTLTSLSDKIGYHHVSRKCTDNLARQFFPDMPPLLEISNKISLIISNTHFSMNGAKPTVPALVEAGGLHISEQQTWSNKFQKLKEILDASKHGVVYFSFGTFAPTQTLPLEKLKAFIRAFRTLKETVVWEISGKILRQLDESLTKNIKTAPLVPQLNVLCHPKVKAFITHGEMLSSQEAVYCGVPMIGIPLFGDQFFNVKNFESQGFAVHLDIHNVTQASLEYALREVLKNPKYGSNAKRVSRLFKDRPVPVLSSAIFWTEHVIEHTGHHLQTSAKNLNWLQYLLLDIFLAFCLVCMFIAYLIDIGITKCCRKYKRKQERPKVKIA